VNVTKQNHYGGNGKDFIIAYSMIWAFPIKQNKLSDYVPKKFSILKLHINSPMQYFHNAKEISAGRGHSLPTPTPPKGVSRNLHWEAPIASV
jgi:hypothetical protein